MKKIVIKLTLIILLSLLFIGCDKDDTELNYVEGYIVGFDPCTINHQYRIGYVIISKDFKDTLVTYNLSDNVFKMPASIISNSSETLYKIPETYFQNYRNSAYFPESVRYEFKIMVSYTNANENEKVFNLCTTDFNYSDFNNAKQIIIKSAKK